MNCPVYNHSQFYVEIIPSERNGDVIEINCTVCDYKFRATTEEL